MPGIVGLITRLPRASAEPQLRLMLKAISYEPFYKTDVYIDESLGVYVGWTVLQGSFSDGMPLRSKSGDVCMVFSGEEYSDDRITSWRTERQWIARFEREPAICYSAMNRIGISSKILMGCSTD